MGEKKCVQLLKKKMDAMKTVKNAKKIVVVCGAGISTQSGIPDFKTLYASQPNLKHALSKSTYKENTSTLAHFLLAFYNASPTPSASHKFIKRLEDNGKLIRCYTMNVDGLETKAGIRNVVQVHGGIQNGGACGRKQIDNVSFQNMFQNNTWEKYNTNNKCTLRPKIVFYGEETNIGNTIQFDIQHSDLILCMGTRLNVDPIASIVKNAHRNGKKCVIVNNEQVDPRIAHIYGDCDTICSRI